MNSRDVKPLSITALSIIAILVLVLHVAGGDLLGQPQANASVVVQDEEAKCPAEVTPPRPSLPFDWPTSEGRSICRIWRPIFY